jgi:hypothetical protein
MVGLVGVKADAFVRIMDSSQTKEHLMKKQLSILSIAAVLSASVIAQQTPATTQSTDQKGVPGVEMNVGSNASDRGLPGVEANIGRDGDQKNINTGTLGAGSATGTNPDGSTMRPMRTDRN